MRAYDRFEVRARVRAKVVFIHFASSIDRASIGTGPLTPAHRYAPVLALKTLVSMGFIFGVDATVSLI